MKRMVTITFCYPDGRKGRCRVPIGIKDIVVEALYTRCHVYDLKVDGMSYEQHFRLYGGEKREFLKVVQGW